MEEKEGMKKLSKVFLTGDRARLRHGARPESCQDTKRGRCGLGSSQLCSNPLFFYRERSARFVMKMTAAGNSTCSLCHCLCLLCAGRMKLGSISSHGHVELYTAFYGMRLESARSLRLFTQTTALAV